MAAEIERIPVGTLTSGHRLELVIHTIRGGAGDGPTLGLNAGTHGDEPIGTETLRRFVTGLDESSFSGTLVVLPVANPYALQALSRNTPIDSENLNRLFPGNPDGTFTLQLAHAIAESFVPRCNYLIDLHSGGNLATVDYVYLLDDNGLAEAYGCELLYRGRSYEGSLSFFARGLGIPTITSELGGGNQRNEYFVDKGIRGITNVMKKLGMLPGEPELPPRQVVVTELTIMRPHHGGFMLSDFDAMRLGEAVQQGTELGRMVSPATFETLEVLTAPHEPTLLALGRERFTKIDPGDYAFMVGNGATAEPLG